jgi:adenine C2-methylase RlmN of 23S rRNA A2503 and tRNA A37
MKLLEHIETLQSRDGSSKMVFRLVRNGRPLEVTCPVNGSPKDMQVVPTHTGCTLGCSFCGLRGSTVSSSLHANEIVEALDRSYVKRNSVRLISFMGAGEPLLNIKAVRKVFEAYSEARHSVASMVPYSALNLVNFLHEVRELNVKFHWSLHSTRTAVRRELMPCAAPAQFVLPTLLAWAPELDVEVHYALIDSLTDTDEDIENLCRWFGNQPITVKLMQLSPCNPTLRPSLRTAKVLQALLDGGVTAQGYCPPGLDIGSSCGMFESSRYC